ncbi:hypothetical protein LguiA_027043 [Lonicera macranthoides]
MGGFVVDYKLYLKESEKLKEDTRLGLYSIAALYDSSYGEHRLNSTVYLFQPYSSVCFTKENKCYGVVAGKWYNHNAITGKSHDKELYWNMLNCVSAADRDKRLAIVLNMLNCVSVADGDKGFAIAYEDGVGLVGYIIASDQPIKRRQSLVMINGALLNPMEL